MRTPDAAGGVNESWQPVAAVWAEITPAGGGETFAFDRAVGRISHVVVIRHRNGVEPAMRFRSGAHVFEIRAAYDQEDRRRWLTCLVEERDL